MVFCVFCFFLVFFYLFAQKREVLGFFCFLRCIQTLIIITLTPLSPIICISS